MIFQILIYVLSLKTFKVHRNSLHGVHGGLAVKHVGTVVEQEHELAVLIVQTSVRATLLKADPATTGLVSFFSNERVFLSFGKIDFY